jgi:glycosyltransferase involved in cell wall biosynthesis
MLIKFIHKTKFDIEAFLNKNFVKLHRKKPYEVIFDVQPLARYKLEFEFKSINFNADKKDGLLLLEAMDFNKNPIEVEFYDWQTSSAYKKPYKYFVSSKNNLSQTNFYIEVPEGVHYLKFSFIKWSASRINLNQEMSLSNTLAEVKHEFPQNLDFVSDVTDEGYIQNIDKIGVKLDFDLKSGNCYQLNFACLTKGDYNHKSVISTYEFRDKQGNIVLPEANEFTYSDIVGYYAYIAGSEAGVRTKIYFTAPEGAKTVKITIKAWASEVAKIRSKFEPEDLGISPKAQKERLLNTIDNYINRLNANAEKPFIVLYTGTKPIGEGSRANRPMVFADLMAKFGYNVIYVYYRFNDKDPLPENNTENLLQVPNDIFHAKLPEIATWNIPNKKLILLSIPDMNAALYLDNLKFHGWKTIYEVRDDWEEFHSVGQAKWYIKYFERYLAKKADFVTTVSCQLAEKMLFFGSDETKTKVIPNAASEKFIELAKPYREARFADYSSPPPNLPPQVGGGTTSKKTIGYFGHLTESWFDWKLLIATAKKLPDFKFEIIGHGEPKDLKIPDNMQLFGSKPHEEIVEISKAWEVAIVPFKIGKLTRGVDPIKYYEYLNLGLKTVASPMPQIANYPLVFTYDKDADFEAKLLEAFEYKITDTDKNNIEKFISENTWEGRVLTTAKLLNVV